MKINNYFFIVMMFFAVSNELDAQENKNGEAKFSILFGMNQIFATNGFNFEVNYWFENFIIDYSHGFGLEFKNNIITDEAKNQNLNFNIRN